MALNGSSVLIEPEAVVLYNNPLVLSHHAENLESGCTLVFKSSNTFYDVLSNPSFLLDPNLFSLEDSRNYFQELPFHFESNIEPNANLAQTFDQNSFHQPEFVDVNNLTVSDLEQSDNLDKKNVSVSDDENDVIFVKEYKKNENVELRKQRRGINEEKLRRNPVRKARTNKGVRHLQKEHLLEEDFDFLDQIDEDNLVVCQRKSCSSPKPSSSSLQENYKEWPENVYERPEFNPETNTIEPFDFTIREIQKQQQKKKPRFETCSEIRRKPKKKYFIRKRKPRANKVEKKVPIKELGEVVGKTFDLVGSFVKATNESDKISQVLSKDSLYALLKNQTSLLAIVNDFGEDEIKKSVNKVLSES